MFYIRKVRYYRLEKGIDWYKFLEEVGLRSDVFI
jgi:hypothetical protein